MMFVDDLFGGGDTEHPIERFDSTTDVPVA